MTDSPIYHGMSLSKQGNRFDLYLFSILQYTVIVPLLNLRIHI